MKCPACHAHNEPDALTCNRCGRELPHQRAPKETMMGLPGILAPRAPADPGAREERSTLFGIPAITDAATDAFHDPHAGGLDEATIAASDYSDDDPPQSSTRIAPQSVVDAALSGSFATQYGLPAIDGPDAPQHPHAAPSHTSTFARAWGLDEESEEVVGSSTQVAGAALVHAILESTHGAESFSKAGRSAPQQHHTLMWGEQSGASDADTPQERTRQVDEAQLAAIRRSATQKFHGIPAVDAADTPPQPAHTPPHSPRSGVLKLARPAGASTADRTEPEGGDRRKKILDKLRGNIAPKPAVGPTTEPAAARDTATPAPTGRAAGPRFSIPRPSAQPAAAQPARLADEPALLDIPVEPVHEIPMEPLGYDIPMEPIELMDVAVEPIDLEDAPPIEIPLEPVAPTHQESFVTIPRESDPADLSERAFGHGVPNTAFAIPSTTSGTPERAQTPHTPSPATSARGVFDSLDGVNFDAEALPTRAAQPTPPHQAPPAPQPEVHSTDSPQSPQNLLRRLWPVFAILALVGALVAIAGAIFLFAGDPFGITLPPALAATALGGGAAIFLCAALFPLVLKWIS